MGTWGVKGFESDSAGDWFGELWDEFPIPAKVEETLKLDLVLNVHMSELRKGGKYTIGAAANL